MSAKNIHLCVIGVGSEVTKIVPAGELWMGNPARFVLKVEA